MKNKLSLTTLMILLLGCIMISTSPSTLTDKTIYLVRHAEKDLTDTTDNPPLTAEGEARAERLATYFSTITFDHIYSTTFQRNMNTVGPLASQQKLAIEMYAWYGYSELVEQIKKSSESNVLICGHGDNIIPIVTCFGGKSPLESLGHQEYDKIFKISWNPKRTRVKLYTY